MIRGSINGVQFFLQANSLYPNTILFSIILKPISQSFILYGFEPWQTTPITRFHNTCWICMSRYLKGKNLVHLFCFFNKSPSWNELQLLTSYSSHICKNTFLYMAAIKATWLSTGELPSKWLKECEDGPSWVLTTPNNTYELWLLSMQFGTVISPTSPLLCAGSYIVT